MITDQALANINTSSEAICALYLGRKSKRKSVSLGSICKIAGISSRGYLSDVIHGKATLYKKYRNTIGRALGLSPNQSDYLKCLIDIDNEKSNSKLKKLEKRLNSIRKVLVITRNPIPTDLETFLFATEVFCAFGLFGNKPKRNDLKIYFRSRSIEEIDAALLQLESLNLIEKIDKVYTVKTGFALFGENQKNISHIDFLKLALQHAIDHVADWYPKKSDAHFSSTIVSVSNAKYKKMLPKIVTSILRSQTELESGDANAMVRFNVQIYPVR